MESGTAGPGWPDQPVARSAGAAAGRAGCVAGDFRLLLASWKSAGRGIGLAASG
jgi:hypothetical protein